MSECVYACVCVCGERVCVRACMYLLACAGTC